MCTFIGSEVILATILNYHPRSKEGIEYSDIETFCNKIKSALLEHGEAKTDYVSFGINDEVLDLDMENNPKQFKKFMNKYYKNTEFNIHNFDNRVPLKLSCIMESVAKSL